MAQDDLRRRMIDLAHGDRLVIGGGEVVVVLERKQGRRARMSVFASESVAIAHEPGDPKVFKIPAISEK
jgi:hypothetical protein